jgi:hypothetical protein
MCKVDVDYYMKLCNNGTNFQMAYLFFIGNNISLNVLLENLLYSSYLLSAW